MPNTLFPDLDITFASEVRKKFAKKNAPEEDPCIRCGLNRKWVLWEGDPSKAKLVIMGDFPSREEASQEIPGGYQHRLPFYNQIGISLREDVYALCERFDVDKDEIYFTNLLKCAPGREKVKNEKGKEISDKTQRDACSEKWLDAELSQLHGAKLFVLMGKAVSSYFLKEGQISRARGRVYEKSGRKFLPTFSHFNVYERGAMQRDIDDFNRDLQLAFKTVSGKLKTEERIVYTPKNVKELEVLTNEVLKRAYTAVDIETSSDDLNRGALDPWSRGARIVSVAFSLSTNEAFFLPLSHPENHLPFHACVAAYKRICESKIGKKLHNGQFDNLFTRVVLGFWIENIICDTYHDHYLLDERPGIHSLKKLVWEYTEEGGYEEELKMPMDHNPLPKLAEYNGRDVMYCEQFSDKMHKDLAANGLMEMHKIYTEGVQFLSQMTFDGMAVDWEYQKSLQTSLSEQAERLNRELVGLAREKGMEDFDSSSPHKVRTLLFDKLKLPYPTYLPKRKNAPIDSTDQTVLSALADEGYDIAKQLLEHRAAAKMLGFVEGLATYRKSDGLLHPKYYITNTVTGRSTAEDPAVQTWPKRKDIRALVVSRFKDGVLIDFDQSQFELRILAVESGDKELTKAFVEDKDIHALVGAYMWNVTEEETSTMELPNKKGKTIRDATKNFDFGLVYQMSTDKTAKMFGITEEEAEQKHAWFFQKFSGLDNYFQAKKREAEEKGEVKSLLGRRRRFPQLLSRYLKQWERESLFRKAINAPIQSLATDIAFYSGVLVSRELIKRGLKSRIILFFHDSLVIDTHPEEANEIAKLVKEIMENVPFGFLKGIPLKATAKSGTNWGSVSKL
jgi:uracil-DNA glycosylase family 4